MGQIFGNNSNNNGTVFHYDVADTVNCYTGEPVNNYWFNGAGIQSMRTHTKHYWDGKEWSTDAPFEGDPGAPGPEGVHIGTVFKHVSGAFNSSWSNNSYGYMLKDLSTPNGAMTAMQSWVYLSPDCNLDGVPAVIEGESGGEATISGYRGDYDLNAKGTWQLIAKKAISDGYTRYIPLYPRKNGVTDGSFTGFLLWGGPIVTVGDRVIPKPQSYIDAPTEELGSIHSNLESSITGVDLTQHNITFDSESGMYFDGSDDYINLGSVLGSIVGAEATVEMVFKSMRTNDTGAMMLGWGRGNDYYSSVGIGSWFSGEPDESVHIGLNPGSSGGQPRALVFARGGSSKYNDQQYHHLVAKMGAENYEIWIDGEKLSVNYLYGASNTYFNSLFSYGESNVDLYIGARPYGGGSMFFKGYIPVLKIYNRAISASDIERNFNSLRKRFDI